jgi:hypothetical protein
MAAKYRYEVIQIPPGATLQQIKDALNAAGQNGWELAQVVQISTTVYFIGKKVLSQ